MTKANVSKSLMNIVLELLKMEISYPTTDEEDAISRYMSTIRNEVGD